jgi:dTDP-4-dehydrorhamnose reductase
LAALSESETFKLRQILAVHSDEYAAAARRPLNSVLCNDRFERSFGFRVGSWQQGLAEVVHEIRWRESGNVRKPDAP